MRQPTSETEQAYTAACTASEQSLAALPFDYARIGEERYARTWNLLQGYAGYRQERDAFLQLSPSADTYIEQMYRVMALQDYLAEYALRLTQATLEQENALYSSTAAHIRHLPWLYLGLFLTAAVLVLLLIRVLSRAVVRPLLRLAQASRSIAEGDFSRPDLPVKSSDEVGRLTGTFNQMKHAMAQQLTTQQALHREEVRNLALEKDLEHTRLEVLKSQVNPHFLFNTLNMISCMARLEDASTTDQMIVHLGSLFRHNLRTKRQQITLEEELDGLEDYIYLQQMRFDGRITVEKASGCSLRRFWCRPLCCSLWWKTLTRMGSSPARKAGASCCGHGCRTKVLVLTVADNGNGMTAEELDAVQAKIVQSEQTGRSIGLGNISRRIGMLYPGGKMQVYSRAGHGTVVRFELPQTQQSEEKGGDALVKCKLLVAEDELIERKVLCRTLQKYLGDLISLYEAKTAERLWKFCPRSAAGGCAGR